MIKTTDAKVKPRPNLRIVRLHNSERVKTVPTSATIQDETTYAHQDNIMLKSVLVDYFS